MQWTLEQYNSQTILWQLALGWSVLTFVVLVLIAIVLDLFGIRLLDQEFRKWIYGVFIVGLLSSVSAAFLNVIKINPNSAAEEVSPNALDKAAQKAYTPPPPAPTASTASTLPPQASVNPSSFRTIIQFAGVLRREDVINLARTLAPAGWNVQGRDRGGERTAAASGWNEIRYSNGNELAAKELARQVQLVNLSGSAIGTAKNYSVDPNTLEVWISR